MPLRYEKDIRQFVRQAQPYFFYEFFNSPFALLWTVSKKLIPSNLQEIVYTIVREILWAGTTRTGVKGQGPTYTDSLRRVISHSIAQGDFMGISPVNRLWMRTITQLNQKSQDLSGFMILVRTRYVRMFSQKKSDIHIYNGRVRLFLVNGWHCSHPAGGLVW